MITRKQKLIIAPALIVAGLYMSYAHIDQYGLSTFAYKSLTGSLFVFACGVWLTINALVTKDKG